MGSWEAHPVICCYAMHHQKPSRITLEQNSKHLQLPFPRKREDNLLLKKMKSNCLGVLHLLLVSGWDAYPSQATIKEQIRGKYCGAHKSSFLFFFLEK